jgi:hypothetical protein
MADDLWPYNPSSTSPPKRGILWANMHPDSLDAPLPVWRKVNKIDAAKLMSEPSLAGILAKLSDEQREAIAAIAEERKENRAQPVKPRKAISEKDTILAQLERVMDEADQAEDLTAKLRAIELRARLHALLNTKLNEDERNIVINVSTGVDR